MLNYGYDKFYPSVNLGVLKNRLRRKIKDRDILWLLDEIINMQDKGLPIGYYSSAWLSNFLLQDLDHKIKEEFGGAAHYIRNVNDMVCFGGNKRKVHKLRIMIDNYLRSIGLHLKGNWQVFRYGCKAKMRHKDERRIERVCDFVGYMFYRDHTKLRKKLIENHKSRQENLKKSKGNSASGFVFHLKAWMAEALQFI